MEESIKKLSQHLHSYGLDDCDYWLPLLEKFGVQSRAALAHIECDMGQYSKLTAQARNSVEKKALYKLLKIDEVEKKEDDQMKEKLKKQKEIRDKWRLKKKKERERKEDKAKEKSEQKRKELSEKQAKAQEILKALQEASSKGLKRSHERVQKLESDIHAHIDVSPESWISSDKSLDELISKLEQQNSISTLMQQREWLSETELLCKCSGGLALKGILLTKNIRDQLEDKSYRLLQVPQDIVITGASQSEDKTEQFSSDHQENEYKKAVEIFGHSVAVSSTIPVYGSFAVSLGASHGERTEDETTHKIHTKEMYSSAVKYSSMQVASFTFENKDLKLSDDARYELKKIKQVLKINSAKSERVQSACKQFFHKYGSHANRGPLYFGGNFWWTCSSRGFQREETKHVKHMQSKAISTSAGFSFAGFGVSTSVNIDKIKGAFEGKCSSQTLASTTLKVKITGGPPEATDLGLWKSGLVASNATWILTDRGRKLIAVWEIIRLNHNKELGEIVDLLRSTWENMTGLQAESHFSAALSHNPATILDEVSEWIKDEDISRDKIERNLSYLLKVRNDIVIEANLAYWISEFVNQPAFHDFLLLIMNLELQPSDLQRIKFLIQQLINQDEMTLLNIRDFRSFEQILEWLYGRPIQEHASSTPQIEITSFDTFIDFLRKTLEQTHLAFLSIDRSEASVIHKQLANNVSLAVNHLQFLCKHSYDEIFITILVYPFQSGTISDVIALKPISLDKLESLHKLFSEERKVFLQNETKSALNFQAYLFHLAIEHCLNNLAQPKQLLQKMMEVMDQLDPTPEKEIVKELNSFLRAHGSSPILLQQTLHALMSATPKQDSHPVKKAGNSLENVLKTAKHPDKKLTKNLSFIGQDDKALVLLGKLGLLEYYPKGLQMKDALCIKSEPLELSLSKTRPSDAQKLPHLVLHKLMSYDSLCRSDLMPAVEVEYHSESESESESDSNSDEESHSNQNNDSQVSSGVHPLDCLLSLIICSDDFLRQDLFSRLAKCQLAVPLILPDPFTGELALPLWGLRSIIKDWKCTTHAGEVVKKIQPIISYKMPIVSFIRLGKYHENVRSKSALLNEVVSDSSHGPFFHRDSPGGDLTPVLGEGLVDMCWYLPGGTADAFPDAITFLNLHGDAREHHRQTQFLSQISSMCFVLLTEENVQLDALTTVSLKQFVSSAGGVTLLGSVNNVPKLLKKKLLLDLKKNIAGTKAAIRSRINKKLDRSKSYQSLEDCCGIEQAVLLVDECSESYKHGLAHATKVKRLITHHLSQGSTSESNLKDTFLPLQGETLWKAWANNDKEYTRQINRGNMSVNEYTEEIKEKKADLRKDQLKHVECLSSVMESFLVSLLELGGCTNGNRILRNYFLQCLKLELNNLSRKSISDMKHQYQVVREELSVLQEKDESKEVEKVIAEINDKKTKLESLQENIISSSFGLEHFFRELGQLYEAALASQLYGNSLCRLPQAAAELLIDGYPLELMDGDAAHVPLQWVTAVLEEAAKLLEDPNIFVLSVLGLQSTGKSTMLNTAFGLQFNVSAGRCTRGAFIQLLPLDDALRQRTKCSYVLVVDTEGLRPPELDSLQTQKHDNELATFVIGLANMTLINIYGEVPGDMDDILQTSVHAFLRMTEVKFNPSCQFVHQNAGASVSSDVGRAKFVKKLNQFTIVAAREENCVHKYQSFNDVIKFNDHKDVHHFPGLWKGDPPMAPVNQGYSQSAQNLKLHLVDTLRSRSTHSTSEEAVSDLHLSTFQTKVQDLWKTLLKEKFVFSFKNSQEITAYNSLETEYSKWNWELREAMLKWEQEAENEIGAADAKAASSVAEKKCKELTKHMSALYDPIQEKMSAFFTGKLSEILVQWKAKFQIRMDNLKDDLHTHAESHCRKLGKSREAISIFEEEKKTYVEKITGQVQVHIANIKREQEELDKSLKAKKLSSDQLKKILSMNLFTKDKLKSYKQQGIITATQETDVQIIIGVGKLSIKVLETVLLGETLGLEQVKQILLTGRQSEDQLEMKFNEIWFDLVQKITPVPTKPVDIEYEVEKALIELVRGQSYEGQLIAELQERRKSFRSLGARLEFHPDEKTHYNKVKTWWEQTKAFLLPWGKAKSTTDCYLIEALQLTEKVFNKARECLKRQIEPDNSTEVKTKECGSSKSTYEKTDFKLGFIQELLHEVDTTVTAESMAIQERITITHEYRRAVLVIICGFAIPKYEEMAKSFREQTDPQLYLEKHVRKPLFTKFKNQYYQTRAEEAIASTLCVHLEEPIKDQVRKKIGSIMVGKMKGSDHYFSSKMALKVKILSDLIEEDDYEGYMLYVRDVQECLQTRIEHYTIQYCNTFEKMSGGTRLQIAAKEAVNDLINVVENTVTEVNNTGIQNWLDTFAKRVVSKLGDIRVENLLKGFDSLNDLNLDNFKLQIRTGLQGLKKNLHFFYGTIECMEDMKHWKDKPHDLLVDLLGCTKQCPFCGEQCDLLDPDHYKENDKQKHQHRTAIHRPSCLAGWRSSRTKIMTSNFCTSLVAGNGNFKSKKNNKQSHPYQKYESIYPEWSIPPDTTSETCLYWKWFVGKYNSKLAVTYNAKPAKVPNAWLDIKETEVVESLADAYKVHKDQ